MNYKLDADGKPMRDAAGKYILVDGTTTDVPPGADAGANHITRDEANRLAKEAATAAAKKASEDADRRLRGQLDKATQDAERLQAELEKRDKEERARQLNALPPDQQVLSRMTDLEQQLSRERAERAAQSVQHQAQVRSLAVQAYRERAVREVPEEVQDLVNGRDEQEIDEAVDNARTVYTNLENKFKTKFSQGAPPGLVAAPPPNPAYVPSNPAPPGVNGFPSVVSPQPVAVQDTPPGGDDTRAMTTEQAVRSGRYSGELREQLHARIRGTRYPGQIGSAPRVWGEQTPAPTQHIQQPQGVQQPQGHQQGAPPPGYVFHPQAGWIPAAQAANPPGAPPPAQPPPGQNGHRSAAQEAVERTYAGTNPIMGENPASQQALADSQAYAQKRGIPSPQHAFNDRFRNTPPIQPNGGN